MLFIIIVFFAVFILISNFFVIINDSLIYTGATSFDSYKCRKTDSDLNDIAKIGRLKNLRALSLHSEYTDDLNAISELYSLEELDLYSCAEVYDWSFLSNLHSLKYLAINRSTFHNNDLNNLKELQQLKKLNINGCTVSSIDNISCCPQLEELALMCSDVSDLSELKNMKKLSYLQISHMNIENFEFVYDLNSLKTLYLFDVQINYNGDRFMDNIKELYLEYMNDIPKNFISLFPDTEVISLYKSYIDSDLIEELTDLPYLKELYISENAVSDSDRDLLESIGIKVTMCNSCSNKYEISASYISD